MNIAWNLCNSQLCAERLQYIIQSRRRQRYTLRMTISREENSMRYKDVFEKCRRIEDKIYNMGKLSVLLNRKELSNCTQQIFYKISSTALASWQYKTWLQRMTFNRCVYFNNKNWASYVTDSVGALLDKFSHNVFCNWPNLSITV